MAQLNQPNQPKELPQWIVSMLKEIHGHLPPNAVATVRVRSLRVAIAQVLEPDRDWIAELERDCDGHD